MTADAARVCARLARSYGLHRKFHGSGVERYRRSNWAGGRVRGCHFRPVPGSARGNGRRPALFHYLGGQYRPPLQEGTEDSVETKLLNDTDGQRTFVLVLETGDEVMACLQAFAERERLSAAQISGIGAFSGAVLTYFDWERKTYLRNPVEEQVEVAALTGDVALAPDGGRAVHIHAVLGRRDGAALAGHLAEARVRPTLELVLTESPAHLRKRHDPETGLALIRPHA